MSALWRGTTTTKARIVSGLVLYTYALLHFLNIGMALIGPEIAETFQQARLFLTRSLLGTLIIYGALLTHGGLALAKLSQMANLRLRAVDLAQVAMGLAIPLLLATHIIFSRASHQIFATNDTVAYMSGLMWGNSAGWQQSLLMLITWAHGSLGLHIWLRLWEGWSRFVPLFTGFTVFVPVFSLAGFLTEGRRVAAILRGDEELMLDLMDEVNWPGPSEFAHLIRISDLTFWAVVGVLAATAILYVARRIRRPGQKLLRISYVGGPTIKTAPGPTLLEMSQAARVPHTALCGGRGRCTTCRVIVEVGAGDLPPPSPSEAAALRAVKAPIGARLACQLRPETPITVYRVFRPDGKQQRAHASQGKEAQLAILFLDMRGFTARTAGQLPYDVVFLLNRFFDSIVPAIVDEGGIVDKYLGDGLLAVFETASPEASAQASLKAARGIGAALDEFNALLEAEGAGPVQIGLSLHLGNVVLGEIGAAGSAPRTLIGDAVNTASRLEGKTKELAVQGLISAPLLAAAGIDVDALPLQHLELRGVEVPLPAWPVLKLTTLPIPD
ncbi:MAG: adenylate/guanylate cyclase domain-containing protein [Aliishimia sp.]